MPVAPIPPPGVGAGPVPTFFKILKSTHLQTCFVEYPKDAAIGRPKHKLEAVADDAMDGMRPAICRRALGRKTNLSVF
jgi:hypothetical protein